MGIEPEAHAQVDFTTIPTTHLTINSIHDIAKDSETNFTSTTVTKDLKFLNVQLGAEPGKPLFSTPALVDSGASATVLDINTIKSFSSLHLFTFTPATSTCKLSLAEKDSFITILGYLSCYLILTDSAGCIIPIWCRIVVASGLKHWCYLGSNLIFCEQIRFTSDDGIFFHKNTPVLHGVSPHCEKDHFVPFMSQEGVHGYLSCTGICRAAGCSILEPQQGATVQANLLATDRVILPEKVMVALNVANLGWGNNISILPLVYPVANRQINLILVNRGLEPVPLEKGLEVGFLHPYNEDDYAPVQVSVQCERDPVLHELSFNYLSLSVDVSESAELSVQQLNVSDLQQQLNQNGVIELPITTIYDKIDEKHSITKDRSEQQVDDVSSLMSMDHLSKVQKELVRKLVSFHRTAFAASVRELSASHLITLDAKVIEEDLSKFISPIRDIPVAQRDEVQDILQDMAYAKIIAPATGKVLLISNLLTRKKKSGALRIILDNRLANAATRKIGDIGSPPLLSLLTDMRKATLVSSSDLASSFFQLPVSQHLSDLLCFRDARRNLWQLRRCPMGYLNSSAALSACVARMKSLPVLEDELSGILAPSMLPKRPTDADDVKLCTSRIPRQIIGRFDSLRPDTLSGQPRFSDLPKEVIKKSHILQMPRHSGLAAYCDDLILHTSHFDVEDRNDHDESLPQDHDTVQQQASGREPHFSLPSGRRVYTGECYACKRNEVTPSDKDFLVHLQAFELLLIQLRKAGLKLSPSKTSIAQHSVQLLGVVWKPGTISISDARLKAYDDISIHSIRSLHSAVASINYFRNQVPHFSELAGPLFEVIRSKKFKWGKREADAWTNLVDVLKQNSTIHIYQPDKPVVLSSDSSSTAAAVVITQACHGRQRLIAASSRTFTASEAAGSIFQKEVLSVIYGFHCFEILLRNAKSIILEIDSRALLWLRFAKDSNPHLTRLSMIISEFGVQQIIHINSRCHIPTDPLSRSTKEVRKFKELLEGKDPMTPRQAEALVHKIAIENGTVYDDSSSEYNLTELLEGPGLPSIGMPKKRSQRQSPSKRDFSSLPPTRKERTIRPPPGTPARFVSSKFRKPNYVKELARARQAQEKMLRSKVAQSHKKEFALENRQSLHMNAITRSMARTDDSVQNGPSSTRAEPPTEPTASMSQAADRTVPENDELQGQTDDEPKGPTYQEVRLQARIIQDGQLTLKNLASLQKQDPTFEPLFDKLNGRSPPPLYKVKDGILFYVKDPKFPRICLPEILMETIIQQHHFTVFSTHTTFTTLAKSLSNKFFHPKLLQVARKICKKCVICAVTLTEPFREGSLGIIPQASKRSLFYADLTLIAPQTYMFLAVDSYSLYVFAQAMPDKSEKSIYKIILLLFSCFGCRTIRFDNESGVFPLVEKLKLFDIDIQFIAPGSSFSNGIVEKRVGLCKETLRTLRLTNAELTADELASLVAYNLNRRIVLGRKFSPEFLLFNQTLPKSNDIIAVATDAGTTDGNLLADIQKEIDAYILKRQQKAGAQRDKFNIGRRKKVFSPGDVVWASNRHLISGGKSLRVTKTGPYIVVEIEKSGHNATLRHIDTGSIIKRRVALPSSADQDFSRLLLNKPIYNQISEAQDDDENDE